MACQIFIPGGAGRYGNYRAAVEAAGGRAVFGAGSAAVESCDGLLLPGGGDLEPWRYGQANTASRNLEPERDALELRLLERFTALKKPVLGICRGLQTVNVFFGGTLVQDLPGHSAVDGRDRTHPIRSTSSHLGCLCGEWAVVNSAHHQAADRLGSGLEAASWAEDGVVESLEHRTLPVWGVQWHPERLPGELGRRLMAAFLERCRENGR